MVHSSLSKATAQIKTDYTKKIIFEGLDFAQEGHLLQVVIIPPNTKQREHYHNKQTEVFYILNGECSIFFNNLEFVAKPGDAFICEPGDRHYLWNRSDNPFELVVFKIDRPEEDDDTVWSDKPATEPK